MRIATQKYLWALCGLTMTTAAWAQNDRAEVADPESSEAAKDSAPTIVATIDVEGIQPAARAEASPSESNADDAPVVLEEIVVTATKRAKSVREIPASVSAISGADLEKSGAKNMEDFLASSPGVSVNKSEPDRNAPSIRGVTTETLFGATQMPVGIFVDDVPYTDPFVPLSTPDLYPFDLDRVELLKGPQGTLFGASSIAGTIRYITEKPEPHVWRAKGQLTHTSVSEGSDAQGYAAALNAPIGDSNAALRFVGVKRSTPGYIDETGRGEDDVNTSELEQGRVSGLWNVTDRLTVNLTYLDQRSETDDYGFTDQRESLERSSTPTPSPREASFNALSFTANYDFDWGSVYSSSNKLGKEANFNNDLSRSLGLEQQQLLTVRGIQDASSDGFTQELRVTSADNSDSPWEWIGGLFYMEFEQDYVQRLITAPAGTLPLPVPVPLPTALEILLLGTDIESKATEKAAFGELTRKFGDHWEATVGGRFYDTQIDAHTVATGVTVLTGFGRPEVSSDPSVSESGFNPKFSTQYRPSDSFSAYALASKGFRFGGVQLLPVSTTPNNSDVVVPETYDSDTVWNYEVGVKTDWLERTVRFDATLFYIDWKDLQITQIRPDGLFSYVDNIGAAHTQGAEVALRLMPFNGMTITSSAAWIEAETDTEFTNTNGTLPSGTRLPGTPEFQISNSATYLLRAGSWPISLTATHSYVGSSYNDLEKTEQIGGYDLFGAQLAVSREGLGSWTDSSIGVALTGNNLADKRVVSAAAAFPGGQYKDFYLVQPRTVELSVFFDF